MLTRCLNILASENVSKASQKTRALAEKCYKSNKKECPFIMVNKTFEFLAFGIVTYTKQEVTLLSEVAFGIVTYTKQEVTLLSEELLYAQNLIACSTPSFSWLYW